MRRPLLKAPFPYFGGKSRVAEIVWKHFGDVRRYIEPFFGSGAVLLGRPHKPQIEIINDKDAMVSNFWRALQKDADAVARWADWPVNETDLHARSRFLHSRKEFQEQMKTDPDFYDSKIAGWWVWGMCTCIGGKYGYSLYNTLPDLMTNSGKGVHRSSQNLTAYLRRLALRLRNVKVCCGDWLRVCSPACVTSVKVTTGVFLDPPYSTEAGRTSNVYSKDDLKISHSAATWAGENGDNKSLRVAFCGYDGEHDMPIGWKKLYWKPAAGYNDKAKSKREVVWFSPHCIKTTLF